MFPVGDTPNPVRFRPYVTWALIAANVAIYFIVSLPLSLQRASPSDPALLDYLQSLPNELPPSVLLAQAIGALDLSAYDLFVFAHGYRPAAPQIADLFSSLFLHGGFMHLAGNMLFLWIFGDNVEHRVGRIVYLLGYLATGVVATLAYALAASSSQQPLVGASGAISGVLGLYYLMFPRNRVKVFIALFPFFFDVVLLPARWVLGFYVLVENLLPFLVGSESHVAYGAHLGGFFAGLGIAYLGERSLWRAPWRDKAWKPHRRHAPSAKLTPLSAAPLIALRAAMARGDEVAALEAFVALSTHDVEELRPDECVVLSESLERRGHFIAANDLLRRCIVAHRHSSTPGLARVYLRLGLLRLAQGQPTAAYNYLLSVLEHEPDPETDAHARQALRAIDVYRPKPS